MNQTHTLTELEDLIRRWGHDRNLIAGNTVDRQFTKTFEEVLEIKEAIATGNDEELMDGIGDTFVTLVLLAAIKDWSLQECANHAYHVIKNRTGKTVDGVFVKDPDPDADLDEPLGSPQPCTDGVCESCQ